MNYWLMQNREYATYEVLHQVIGVLNARKNGDPDLNIKGQKTIDIDYLLQYIEENITEETERLNKAFPDKA